MSEQLANDDLKELKFASRDPAISIRYEVAHIARLKQLLDTPKLDSSDHEKIKSYLKLRYKDTNTFKIEYLFSKNSPNCRLQKKIGKCVQLEKFVGDRDDVLKDTKLDKEAVLKALNSSYVQPKDKTIRAIHTFIYTKFVPFFQNKPEFKALWAITKKNKPFNTTGSFYSKVLQYYENKILTQIDLYAMTAGFSVNNSILEFDGYKILQSDTNAPSLNLFDLEDHIFKTTGFRIQLCEKPMTVSKEWLESLDLEPLPLTDTVENVTEPTSVIRMPLFDDGELNSLVKDAIVNPTHDSIAKFLSVLWKDDLYYHNTEWWFFHKHHWQKDNGTHFTHRMLNEFRQLLDKLTEWRSPSQDAPLCNLLKVTNNLIGNRTFYKNDFEPFHKQLNKNLSLLCFRNGVYDLNALEFRNGRPNDYCELQIQYDFRPYDPSCSITQKLKDTITKVLPDKEKRDYVLQLFAAALGCHTVDTFNILFGGGANAKSWLLGLMCYTLDCYGLSWNTSFLVHDISGESANPELADGKDKRFIEIQESKKNKALNMENVKKLTGYDRIRARKLYQNGIQFVITAMIILSVNDLPKIVETDRGSWRRMNVITLDSTFVDNKDDVDEKKHIYLADCELEKQHEANAPYFMSILIHYYKRFREEGNKTPKVICDKTLKFRKSNDIYYNFFKDCCSVKEGERIHTDKLWSELLKWAKTQQISTTEITRMDMIKWFKKLNESYPIYTTPVEYKDKLRHTVIVDNRSMSKVSTGFTGIQMNKYQVDKEEDDDEDNDSEEMTDTQWEAAVEEAEQDFKNGD
ncbi:hypothetical protein BC832DRAFT_543182 [Gaertneriomyces semiglobifer]|nr:hypothetical protein BC832DRAFT_543182 [Gaertneriomyces semiglobifer]